MQRLAGVSAALYTIGCVDAGSSTNSPVTKVVKLLNELKSRIEGDGKAEQQSYDKNSCWCEDTLARKAKDISDGKQKIKELSDLILKLEAETGTHSVEIAQLNKDLGENKAAQKEAQAQRDKQHAEYSATKTEAEQCLGALGAAIPALSGAGEGKKAGFLSTSMHEAHLLSVAAGLRTVLALVPSSHALSDEDVKTISHFVSKPADFASVRTPALVAVQAGQNPFGDYAPKSGQIQGILKGLEEAFEQNLEKANKEEAEQVKAFDELMATKKQEHSTLQASLKKHTSDNTEKSTNLAESKQLRDDTEKQLKADEAFFKDTKASCVDRARDWAERSRLRTEELQGVATAIQILDSDEAKATFKSAATTFLQEGALHTVTVKRVHNGASSRLRKLAMQFPAVASLSELASEAETRGHFDKVIVAIDKMIAELREEEADDIAHRDRCQGESNKNSNDMDDLQHTLDKADASIDEMEDKAKNLQDDIDALNQEISETNAEMEEALKMRNKAHDEFKQALGDDMNGVKLLEAALVSLGNFYKRNKIPMALVQEPEYTVDQDKMPEKDMGDYKGRQSDSAPVIGMIAQIKEDLEMEIKTGRQEEAGAQADYEKQRAAMTATLNAQEDSKAATDKDLADLKSKIADKTAFRDQTGTDLSEQEKLKKSITTDCAWVDSHFDTRREKRKTEIDGLVDAKNFLAGGGDSA